MRADTTGQIEYDCVVLTAKLRENLRNLLAFFRDDDTVKHRIFAQERCCAVFLDGMVNSEMIDRFIIEPIQRLEYTDAQTVEAAIGIGEVEKAQRMSDAAKALLQGDTLVLLEGHAEIWTLGTKGFALRSIAEPDNEKSLFGPREGFTENMLQNTSMIRRKLTTSDCKFRFRTIGSRSNSRYCLCYLESLVNRDTLRLMQERLDAIQTDGFLDTYAINEWIRDEPYSLFSTIGKTERPDTVAAKLLNGGVALLLDGDPVALIAPYLFMDNFRSQDDYYLGFYYASISRLLRFLAFLISIGIGALYIGLIAFHTEMLPTSFLLAISTATSGLPMPTFLEFLFVMLLFEMLREAGVRMSSKIGQSLSIVGALVIGQAAVEARFISAPMVIIVSIAAITGLMIPGLSSVVIIVRMLAVVAASLFGLEGIGFVFLALIVHLFSLRSFGIQYTANMFSLKRADLQDIYVRAPAPLLKFRTKFIARDRRRSR